MTDCIVRGWKDQPAFLEDGESLCRTGEVQVIRHGYDYYVTKGNLFGSQTIKAKDADDAFFAVQKFHYASSERPLNIEKYGWEFIGETMLQPAEAT